MARRPANRRAIFMRPALAGAHGSQTRTRLQTYPAGCLCRQPGTGGIRGLRSPAPAGNRGGTGAGQGRARGDAWGDWH